MSTLHERLLAELDPTAMWAPSTSSATGRMQAALRVVVELHAPIQLVLAGTPDQFIRCPLCPGGCDTITAVAAALGVEIEETP